MQLQKVRSRSADDTPLVASPTCCPNCGDRMVAPETSEFVDSVEIRHHWRCEACLQPTRTSVRLIWH